MMKNTLFAVLAIFVLGNLCRLGLPWWSLAPIAAMVGWTIPRNGWGAFFAGLLGGFLLWYSAAWWADRENASLLSAKVGQLFMGIKGGELLLATGLLGGLLAGFSALTGRMAKDWLVAPVRKRSYLQQRRR